jgi:hypothetical protein
MMEDAHRMERCLSDRDFKRQRTDIDGHFSQILGNIGDFDMVLQWAQRIELDAAWQSDNTEHQDIPSARL